MVDVAWRSNFSPDLKVKTWELRERKRERERERERERGEGGRNRAFFAKALDACTLFSLRILPYLTSLERSKTRRREYAFGTYKHLRVVPMYQRWREKEREREREREKEREWEGGRGWRRGKERSGGKLFCMRRQSADRIEYIQDVRGYLKIDTRMLPYHLSLTLWQCGLR